MNKPITIDPDKCATRAESAFQEVRKLGRRQIDAAIMVGQHMSEAKAALDHGKFGPAFRRWREEGMITFSERSRVRWMLLAKHGATIKTANLANLGEAEKLAQQLENDGEKDNAAEDGTGERSAGRKPKQKTPEQEIENCIVKALQKLPAEEQKGFLEQIIEFVRRRLELY